ncbi:hypothetical protein FACS1894133_7130 [Clostridia bacterium]|nr:hypothetical protein FACS1894133_7130 [Clostridia bacterium]
MGMSDMQFASHRRQELEEFEDILEIVKKIQPDSEAVKKLERLIRLAKADVEV